MPQVLWIEENAHYESLAVCLRALLAGAGREVSYEELAAVLGFSTTLVAVRGEALGWWCTFARDTHLYETARLYGVRLRALHPQAASRGLESSSEFAGHFRDSYAPLIERALEHDQPVLVWRGWPAPRERLWGLIIEFRSGMFIGHSLWHNGQPIPLVSAAHQVYVVEHCDQVAKPLAQTEQFERVRKQTLSAWRRVPAANESIVCGAAAYADWQERLSRTRDDEHEVTPRFRQHAQATRVLVSARRYLAIWLRSIGDALAPAAFKATAHWAGACDRIVDLLSAYTVDEAVGPLLDSPAGVREVCAALDQSCRIERETVDVLGSLDS